jgi:putative two-component system response regulator
VQGMQSQSTPGVARSARRGEELRRVPGGPNTGVARQGGEMERLTARILVVDDEESIRTGVSRRLQAEGYACTMAASGNEALAKASGQDFDLVLMDIKMPGLSGMEALPKLLAEHPDASVVMITAVNDTQTAVEAMKLGALDYVTKPFDVDGLVMRVEKALERRMLVVENRHYQSHLEQMVEQQVGQIRQYYDEAIQALAREEMALAQLSEAPPSTHGDDCGEACLEMATVLARAAEARESYARGHSERVALVACDIAAQLGCPDELVRDLHLAALVHDIGKIAVPERILFKQGRLSSVEWSEIRSHPLRSVEMIRHLDSFKGAMPIVESHHERHDGKGYPHGLKGEDIPLGARILAVANAYDAMSSPRPYRPRLSNDDLLRVLTKGADSQWDPAVVDALMQTLSRADSTARHLPVGTG